MYKHYLVWKTAISEPVPDTVSGPEYLCPDSPDTINRIDAYSILPRKEHTMAHKKVERKKELDRRRHRREERLKQRIHEAKAAKKA